MWNMFKVNNKDTRRSIHQRCSVKKGVLQNFANFTGKQLCWSLFSIKLQALGLVTLLKRDFSTGIFLWNLRNFKEHRFWRTFSDDCFCMIIKVPLYIKIEDWIKLVKSMAMKTLKTMIKRYNSSECSGKRFENVILI